MVLSQYQLPPPFCGRVLVSPVRSSLCDLIRAPLSEHQSFTVVEQSFTVVTKEIEGVA